MELTTQRLVSAADNRTPRMQPDALELKTAASLRPCRSTWEELVIGVLRHWSIPALRVALGLVFIWFGALKVFGVSPVIPMVRQTYAFLPLPLFGLILGAWEIVVGSGLIFKRALRATLVLLCLHLVGTFATLWLAPPLFFLHGNPLLLTANGEFVIKNLVLVTAGFVIGGYEVIPLSKDE